MTRTEVRFCKDSTMVKRNANSCLIDKFEYVRPQKRLASETKLTVTNRARGQTTLTTPC